jgi:hypothetical protein
MEIARIYSGSDGQSRIGVMEIPFEERPGIGLQSRSMQSKAVFIREKPGSHESGWHCVPQRQLVILLEGELEVEIGDGTKRRFSAGDVFLCEDTTGQGQKVRGMNRKTVVVQLA